MMLKIKGKIKNIFKEKIAILINNDNIIEEYEFPKEVICGQITNISIDDLIEISVNEKQKLIFVKLEKEILKPIEINYDELISELKRLKDGI